MEAVFDNDLLPLLGAYKDLGEEEPSPERLRRLVALVVDLLRVSGLEAAPRSNDLLPMVALRHEGQSFIVGLAWTVNALGASESGDLVQAMRAVAGDASMILLSMSGFDSPANAPAFGGTYTRTLLWDRTHLEAALCGLASVSDLLVAGTRTAFFDAAAYVTLTRLLAGADDSTCPRMATPDLLPPPWPVLTDS